MDEFSGIFTGKDVNSGPTEVNPEVNPYKSVPILKRITKNVRLLQLQYSEGMSMFRESEDINYLHHQTQM